MTTTVPRLWSDSTVVVLATGPSLTQADVDLCRGSRVVAIKDAIRLAPWADALYACGEENDMSRWWSRNEVAVGEFAGLRFTLDPKAALWATPLQNTGELGLEASPHGLRTGRNSGYQAINLAYHLGASKIVLLGYDMQAAADKSHFFGPRPWRPRVEASTYACFIRCFWSLIEPLRLAGVSVLNATRQTALTCWPCVSLQEALA